MAVYSRSKLPLKIILILLSLSQVIAQSTTLTSGFDATSWPGASDACIAALSVSVPCHKVLSSLYGITYYSHWSLASLQVICQPNCYTSLQEHSAKVLRTCRGTLYYDKLTDAYFTPNILDLEMLYAYNQTCLQSNGAYCETFFQNSTSISPCDDCWLKLLQFRVNNNLNGPEAVIESAFVSLTQRCSVQSYPTTTPIPALVSSASVAAPTCTGTYYKVQPTDTIWSVSISQRMSTQNLLNANGLSYNNTDFPTSGTLCIQNQCAVYIVAVGDTCAGIAKLIGVTAETLISWNSVINPLCSNLGNNVGYTICITNPFVTTTTVASTTEVSAPTSTYSYTGHVDWTYLPFTPYTDLGPSTTAPPPFVTPLATGTYKNCIQYLALNSPSSFDCWMWAYFYEVENADFILWNPSLDNFVAMEPADYTYPCTLEPSSSYCMVLSATRSVIPKPTPTDDAPSPIATDQIAQCFQWEATYPGMTCDEMLENTGLSFARFYQMNPSILSDCSNLLAQTYYCVASYVAFTGKTSSSAWTLIGCYSDNTSARTLLYGTDVAGGPSTTTVESCQAACSALGYSIAGLEYGQQCFCDSSFNNGGGPASDGNAQCNMACLGNSTQICGGPNRLSVYGLTGWSLLGCYTDNTSARSLGYGVTSIPATLMTIERCESACYSLGYKYAGLEYAQQCFCGNTISNGGALVSDGCNMACLGNSTETCGGSNRLSIYQNTKSALGWMSLGCYSDTTTARALAHLATLSGGAATTTIQACQSACLAAGFSLAGVEYGQQCWCDNSLRVGGPASDGNAQCNVPCAGNSTQTCGGANRMNIYQYYTGWDFLGCYVDSSSARTLTELVTVPGGQAYTTIETCQRACKANGYNYAGVEYGQECRCDNYISSSGTLAPDGNAQCNMKCVNNTAEICGGSNRIDVYHHKDTMGIRSWKLLGCYTDSSSARTLAYGQTISTGPSTLTIEICQAICHDAGYILAGVEYGQECYCDQGIKNGTIAVASTCNMACLGNSAEICGGSSRISVYQYA